SPQKQKQKQKQNQNQNKNPSSSDLEEISEAMRTLSNKELSQPEITIKSAEQASTSSGSTPTPQPASSLEEQAPSAPETEATDQAKLEEQREQLLAQWQEEGFQAGFK